VERPSAAALAGLVSSTWVKRITLGAAPYVHRNIPKGGVELLCRLGSVPQLAGPLTRARVESLAPGSIVVGLRFHPGAAATVLGMPASELADLMVDADTVWGREVAAVGERMAEASSVQRRTLPRRALHDRRHRRRCLADELGSDRRPGGDRGRRSAAR
jgi:hypothetical protein